MAASPLAPPEVRFALRPGRGELALHATGFRHPRSRWSRTDHFTAYADLTHLRLGARHLRIGTRQGVWLLARSEFAEPATAPEALVRALIERVAAEPGGAGQLARMAEAEELQRQPIGLRVTPIAAALCGAGFVLQLALGPVVHHAGFMSPLLASAGEPWRLLTANLLHADAVHLLLNVLGLLVLGALVERPLGATRTLLVLGLAGIAATASSWLAGYDVLVGASGLVAGLAGAALWLELRRPEYLPVSWRIPRRPFVAALIADALLPMAVPFIAGAAHVGGFLGGMAGAALSTGATLRRESPRPALRLAATLVAVAASVSLGSAARLLVGGPAWEGHAERLLAAERPPALLMNDAAWLIVTARQATGRALSDALELAERAVRATGRRDPNILDTLAEAQFRAGDADAAVATIDEAIALAPREPYFQEQRRRFVGERDADDRPPPPSTPFFAPDERDDPIDPFEQEPGVEI